MARRSFRISNNNPLSSAILKQPVKNARLRSFNSADYSAATAISEIVVRHRMSGFGKNVPENGRLPDAEN